MGRVRQKRTRAEEVVAGVLRDLGVGYRRNVRSLPGSPDLVNRRRGWVIQVQGCFWHRHEGCKRTTTPARNREFWLRKFAQNVARDQRDQAALERLGLRVAIVWECETTDVPALRARLAAFVGVAEPAE